MARHTRKIRNRRRNKKGGDIESGPEPVVAPMTSIPPDPERFNKYDAQMRADLSKPVSKEMVENVFAGPTPEQKSEKERQMMENEDPQYADPWTDLTIFSNTGGKRKRRRNKRKTKRLNKKQTKTMRRK